MTVGRFIGAAILVACAAAPAAWAQDSGAAGDTWSVKADYIEACSCHLFCPCYFNTKPEGGMHCKFNNAVRIAEGHVGAVKVDGAKFWLSGDLGGDFSQMKMKGAVLTFDTATTPEQQKAIQFLVGQIYPVQWEKVETEVAPILWEEKGDTAHAKVGDAGEVTLTVVKDSQGKPTVVQNLNYWGAKRNDGFRLAKSVHRYKGHGYDYAYDDHNGFLVHIESEGKVEEPAKK